MNLSRCFDMPCGSTVRKLAGCAVKLSIGSLHVGIKLVEQDNGLFQSVTSVRDICTDCASDSKQCQLLRPSKFQSLEG